LNKHTDALEPGAPDPGFGGMHEQPDECAIFDDSA